MDERVQMGILILFLPVIQVDDTHISQPSDNHNKDVKHC